MTQAKNRAALAPYERNAAISVKKHSIGRCISSRTPTASEFALNAIVRSKRGHRRVRLNVTDYYADFEGSLKYHVERCKGGKSQAIETKGGLLAGAVDKIGSRIINDKIAAWIIEASPPLRVVDGEAFRRIYATINPTIHVYSRRELGRRIENAFTNAQQSMQKFFLEFDGEVALTSDAWTSGALDGYMGVTAHWIDKNWDAKSVVLDLCEAPISHTGENLARTLLKVIKEYNLSSKVISMTSDNAENMVVCCRRLSEQLESDEFVHIRCSAHIINLIATASFDLVQPRLEAIRSVVTLLNRSPKVSAEYRDTAVTDEEWKADLAAGYKPSAPNSKRKINLDVKTRWSSTYRMLNYCLRVRIPWFQR